LFTLCQKGYTVIDVGTNIGYVLLKFAQIVGPQGKVYGFEPDPFNYFKCLHNLSLNKFTNIHVENCGLGHLRGSFNLSVDTNSNRGGNRITLGDNSKEMVKVKVIKLDNFIAMHHIPKIDLVKIDVEGFELNVLKGAENIIKQHQPTLFIELDDNNLKQQGQSARELVEFVVNLGYQVTHAEVETVITPNNDFRNIHIDIICKHAAHT
jgi:FkbM family methyltransferase